MSPRLENRIRLISALIFGPLIVAVAVYRGYDTPLLWLIAIASMLLVAMKLIRTW